MNAAPHPINHSFPGSFRLMISGVIQGILTKGLQNSNGLVQQATLSTLCNMLTALQQTLLSLDRAQCQAQKDYNNMLSAQHITEDIDTGKPPEASAPLYISQGQHNGHRQSTDLAETYGKIEKPQSL